MGREIFLNKGDIFGKLAVIKHSGYTKPDVNGNSQKVYKCKCECGNITEVNMHKLRYGRTKSCGCFKSEKLAEANRTHDLSYHPAFGSYKAMLDRCYNENNIGYIHYGGRGIKVCKEWKGKDGVYNFCNWASLNGHKRGLHINRIDNNDNYKPDNCEWVTPKINNINKSNTVFIEEIKLSFNAFWELNRENNVPYDTASKRYQSGMDALEAVTKPVRRKDLLEVL